MFATSGALFFTGREKPGFDGTALGVRVEVAPPRYSGPPGAGPKCSRDWRTLLICFLGPLESLSASCDPEFLMTTDLFRRRANGGQLDS